MIDTNPEVFTVPLSAIIKEFSLEALYLPALPESILISNKHVNRLGLPFIGFYNHFEHTRIELIGKAEHLYLQKFSIYPSIFRIIFCCFFICKNIALRAAIFEKIIFYFLFFCKISFASQN